MTDLETVGPLWQHEERGTATSFRHAERHKEGIPASHERGNGEEKDGEKKERGRERREREALHLQL